jgi:hypothetical protein
MPATQNKEGKRGPSPSEAGATEQSEVVGDMDDEIHPETREAGQDRTYHGPRNGRDRRAENEANHDGDREEGAEKKKASFLASHRFPS